MNKWNKEIKNNNKKSLFINEGMSYLKISKLNFKYERRFTIDH